MRSHPPDLFYTTLELRNRQLPTSVQMSTSNTPPEETPPSPAPALVLSKPRDPGNFSGSGEQDVEEWLLLYERISTHNRWDPTIMLANVIFYLKDTARTWFLTHEEGITSWDMCKEQLQHLFGDPIGRKLSAKRKLASRVQTPTESYIAYIQDILSLCQKADPNMPDSERVPHILKGIADDAFQLLVFKDCATADAVIKECRRFEEAKKRRITANFIRLPNTAPTSSCEDPTSQTHHIAKIVRRELEAMSPSSSLHAPPEPEPSVPISTVQAIVREEMNRFHAPTYTTGRRSPLVHQTPNSPPPGNFSYRRDPAAWRTPDNRPICFHCSGVGHIQRYCRNRSSNGLRSSESNGYRPSFDGRFRGRTASTRSDDNQYTMASRNCRSPSPLRRQSLSPAHRRYMSPTRDHAASEN